MGREIRKLHSKRIAGPSSAQLATWGLCKTEFRTVSPVRAVGWESDRQVLNAEIYSQADPLPWQSSNLWKGRMYPALNSCRSASTPEALQNRQDRLKKPLQGAYPQEKDGKRKAKRAHFCLRETKYTN